MKILRMLNKWNGYKSALAIVAGLGLFHLALSAQPAGNQPGGIDLRIVGGEIATASDYPWMVGLVSGDESDLTNAQFCGGSLIAPTWVITAAHCVENEIPGNVDVVIGSGDLRDASQFRRIRVARIISHPAYFALNDGIDADIALLELTEAVEDLELLPVIDDESLASPGVMSRALGWGLTTEGGSPSAVLREVDVPIVSLETANATGAFDQELTADMLPAGFPGGGKDSCNGDSGGPLVVRNQADDGYVLAGIVSFGSHLGCAAPDAFGIYTRVSFFGEWIQQGLAGELEVVENPSEPGQSGDDFPDFGDEFPDFGDGSSDFGDEFPDFGDEFPDFGDEFPDFGDEFPDFGDEFPDFGDESPEFGDEFPDFGDEFPGFGDEEADFGDGGSQFADEFMDSEFDDPEWLEIWNLICGDHDDDAAAGEGDLGDGDDVWMDDADFDFDENDEEGELINDNWNGFFWWF